MGQFKNANFSHSHSLEILEALREHDTFMDSVTTVADFGCGSGMDILWWATRETRDEPPEPLNYLCYAVDKDPAQFNLEPHKNIMFIEGNFEKRVLSREVDVIWCHDAFQYAVNPLATLAVWNQQLVTNGMLYIGIPLHGYSHLNRWQFLSRSYEYYHHTFLSMVYMLAVNGFDCKDAYFRKRKDDAWLHSVVFKTGEPMDPATTSWHDLVERKLVHDSIGNSILTHGYPRLEDVFYPWLDRDNHRIIL